MTNKSLPTVEQDQLSLTERAAQAGSTAVYLREEGAFQAQLTALVSIALLDHLTINLKHSQQFCVL